MSSRALSVLAHIGLCLLLYLCIEWLHRESAAADDIAVRWSIYDQHAQETAVELPHQWSSASTTSRAVVYKGRFEIDRLGDAPYALYISSIGSNAQLSINGVALETLEQAPLERHRFHPLLLSFPNDYLRTGSNELTLRVREAPPGSGFLGASFLSLESALEPRYRYRWILKVAYPAMLVVAGLIIGAIATVLWIIRPQTRFFLHYALACYLGSAWVICSLVTAPLLPPLWWDAVSVLVLIWFGIAIGNVGMDYLNALDPPFLRSQMISAAIAPVAILGGTVALGADISYGWIQPAALWIDLAGALFLLLFFFNREYSKPRRDVPVSMLQSGLLLLVVNAHDNPLLIGFPDFIDRSDGLFFVFPATMTLMTATFNLLKSYVGALTDSEKLNSELTARVAAREAEIERSYKDLAAAEKSRALADERERLLADMHDGMGGTLVAALARLENQGAGEEPSAQAIRDALDDLRLILASLDPVDRSPANALALLRDRLEPLCQDADIALDFDLREMPDLNWDPTRTLQLLRITQEACINAVRHAGARQLSLRARTGGEGQWIEIVIDDDGVGYDHQASSRAGQYGTGNMQRRAKRLSGTLSWQRLSRGTRVELRIPTPPVQG